MYTIGNKENNVYFGGTSAQGFIFKSEENFKYHRDEICYIAEGGFDGKLCLSENEARAEIDKGGAWTHNSIVEYLKENLPSEIGEEPTDEFIENVAEYLFDECDWQCISTLYCECDFAEDWEYYKEGK